MNTLNEVTNKEICTDLAAGSAGEHLVCADLIMQGYSAFLSDRGLAYDVVVEVDNKLLKVQVKSTRTYRRDERLKRKNSLPYYMFDVSKHGKKRKRVYTPNDVDLFALVNLTTRQVGYLSTKARPIQISLRVDEFKGQYFNEIQEKKLREAFLLKQKGHTNLHISSVVDIDNSYLGTLFSTHIKNGKLCEKLLEGIYFKDIPLSKALGELA